MKTSFLLVGLLVTTVVGAQIHSAPPAARTLPRDGVEVTPTGRVGDATAIDPQFDLLRKQISALKRQQTEQQNEIAQLQACVSALVKATKSSGGLRQVGAAPMDNSPGMLANTSSLGEPLGEDEDGELDNRVAKLAPRATGIELGGCD